MYLVPYSGISYLARMTRTINSLQNYNFFCILANFFVPLRDFMRLKSNVNIKNRRATFDYEVLERYTAGIQLFGTEIKSIRDSKASLVDTYCQFVGNELWVKQMHIAEYRFGSYANHEAKRDRKLLLNRKELNKLAKQVKDTGKTIIPLRLFINENGFAKMEIALCQGKHTYDKRQALRAADDKRELQRAMRNHQ